MYLIKRTDTLPGAASPSPDSIFWKNNFKNRKIKKINSKAKFSIPDLWGNTRKRRVSLNLLNSFSLFSHNTFMISCLFLILCFRVANVKMHGIKRHLAATQNLVTGPIFYQTATKNGIFLGQRSHSNFGNDRTKWYNSDKSRWIQNVERQYRSVSFEDSEFFGPWKSWRHRILQGKDASSAIFFM